MPRNVFVNKRNAAYECVSSFVKQALPSIGNNMVSERKKERKNSYVRSSSGTYLLKKPVNPQKASCQRIYSRAGFKSWIVCDSNGSEIVKVDEGTGKNTWSCVSDKLGSRRTNISGRIHSLAVRNRFSPLSSLNEIDDSQNKCTTSKSSGNNMNIALLNARSLRHKTQIVKDLRDEFHIDIFLFVETWLKHDDQVEIGELERNGECVFIHEPRSGHRQGGGVGCLVRAGLNAMKKANTKPKTFECLEIELQCNGKTVTLIVVYRPEPTTQNNYQISEFFDEFTQFLAHYQTYQHEVVITGDFNFHMNKPYENRVVQFNNILEMFDLVQHVKAPTHREGNTLDLVITRKTSILSTCSVGDLVSDHKCISLNLNLKSEANPQKKIKFRKTRGIDIMKFRNDLSVHISEKRKVIRSQHDPTRHLDELVELYNSISSVLDAHAPEKYKNVILRKPTPWTNADIKDLKTEKRKAEKKWRKSRQQGDWEIFKEKRNAMNLYLNKSKSDDLKEKIKRSQGDSKSMFKILNASLNRKQELPLPHHTSEKQLSDDFNTFFIDKISKIRSELQSNEQANEPKICNTADLSNFKPLTHEEVQKLIAAMPVKHCALDPLPTWLLLKCIDKILPLITEIINLSLKNGTMPSTLKHALVKPLLKKASLEPIKKNYRPVSNLSFLSKIIESAVIKQFNEHMKKHKLDDKKQSAYKKFYSTETLLTKIHNDIMLGMSKGEVMILVLLDLSAAFDTIDHKILIRRLQNRYGINGNALGWFESYISERSQAVSINEAVSEKLYLNYGVPQGSKLGPILFNSYIAPVSEVAKRNNVSDEKYADDEQLILSFKPNSLEDQTKAVQRMEKCIKEIREFLHENMLCNNGDKTELLLIGTSQQLKKLKFNSIDVDNVKIMSVDSVRNLGIMFDQEMTMDKQVNKMCKSAYFNLRNISKIKKSLDRNTIKTAVNALVTPHLDYGNGLLYGISQKLVDKLQVAQNSAVRLIKQLKKHDHITSHRKDLHWLPIPARTEFKILTITWKALNDLAPDYIKCLIKRQQPTRQLRSCNRKLLDIPNSQNTNKMADRSFSHAAPQLWNDLPEKTKNSKSLENFKKNLKTHLFTKYYKEHPP